MRSELLGRSVRSKGLNVGVLKEAHSIVVFRSGTVLHESADLRERWRCDIRGFKEGI